MQHSNVCAAAYALYFDFASSMFLPVTTQYCL
uniref:Uncharacterized protein n=1 Tax=Rhizophora mucronata TaxID=61149 RepID=A0A2P2NTL8_RHIMU